MVNTMKLTTENITHTSILERLIMWVVVVVAAAAVVEVCWCWGEDARQRNTAETMIFDRRW